MMEVLKEMLQKPALNQLCSEIECHFSVATPMS